MGFFGKSEWRYLELKREIAAIRGVALPNTFQGKVEVKFCEEVNGRWCRLSPRQRLQIRGHYYTLDVAVPFFDEDDFERIMLCIKMNNFWFAPRFRQFDDFGNAPDVAFTGFIDEGSFLRANTHVSARLKNDWDFYPDHKLNRYEIVVGIEADCPKGSLAEARRRTPDQRVVHVEPEEIRLTEWRKAA